MSAKILLVEDDPIWQGAIGRCMEEEGYEVEVVRDVKAHGKSWDWIKTNRKP